jgi:hypothetical protein
LTTNPAKQLFSDREDFRSFHKGEAASFVVIGGLYGVALLMLCAVWIAREFPWPAALPVDVVAFLVIGWCSRNFTWRAGSNVTFP